MADFDNLVGNMGQASAPPPPPTAGMAPPQPAKPAPIKVAQAVGDVPPPQMPGAPINNPLPANAPPAVGGNEFAKPGEAAPNLRSYWTGGLSPEEQALLHERNASVDASLGSMAATMQQYAKAAAEAPAGTKERMAAIADMRRASQEMQEEFRRKVMSPPIERPVDSFKNFGSAATVLGLLVGLLSRQHLTAGLGAAGAAMRAINTNDHEAFEKSYETWKLQTQMGLQMINMENQDIRQLLDDQRMAVDERAARLQTMATELGFDKALASLGADKYDAGLALLEKRDALTAQAQNHADMMQLHYDQMNAAAQNRGWQVLYDPSKKDAQGNPTPYRYQPSSGRATTLSGEPYEPSGAAKLSNASQMGQNFSDKDVDFWANVLKNGGKLPPGLSRTAGGSMLVQKLMKRMPELGQNPGEFISNIATVKANEHSLLNMTKMADAATSFERTAKENFDYALKLAPEGIPTNWGPWLNKWVETGETQAGDAHVPPYVTALLTAANEYAKIMSGSTGAQGSTVDSRREAAELFSPYLNQGQIKAVVTVAERDMSNRRSSLYGQVDDIRARLQEAGSGAPSATSVSGGLPVPPPHVNDADGTQYRGSNGVTYIKRGNEMVPQQ